MKPQTSPEKTTRKVQIGELTDTKFKPFKADSHPQSPCTPKNFRFFGKPRNITSRGIIHSIPTVNHKPSTSSANLALFYKSVQQTELWSEEPEELSLLEPQKDKGSKKYQNLENLLLDDGLFNSNERNKHFQTWGIKTPPKSRKPNLESNKSMPNDLKSLPAFRKVFCKPANSPQKQSASVANRINENLSPTNFNSEQLINRAKSRNPTSYSSSYRKPDTNLNYYGLEAIGYQNYKYPKAAEPSSIKRRNNNQTQPQNRETIESCIQNIHNQKMLLQNIKSQEDFYTGPEKILEDTFWNRQSATDSKPEQPAQVHSAQGISNKRKLEPIRSDRSTHNRVPSGFQSESIHNLSYEGKMIIEEKITSPMSDKTQLVAGSNINSPEKAVKPLLRKVFTPDLKRIIVNKKQSFNLKQLRMEFDHFSEISQIYLENYKIKYMDSPRNQSEYKLYQLNNAIKEKGVCLHVFLETQDFIKHQKKTIVNRILLAIGMNLASEFPIISFNQFQTLKRIAVSRDLPNSELIDFVIKFFKLEESSLQKESFLRILRTLTEKVDNEAKEDIGIDDLFDTFVENYKLTGILKENENYVDLERFKQVYLFNKMNILDLIDLITGVN